MSALLSMPCDVLVTPSGCDRPLIVTFTHLQPFRRYCRFYMHRANHRPPKWRNLTCVCMYLGTLLSWSTEVNDLKEVSFCYNKIIRTAYLAPNMQTVLSQLLLADVSHRSFMTKQELAYHVTDLPAVRMFSNIAVVGCYQRSYLNASSSDNRTIIYSARIGYSEYAECCRDSTEIINHKNAKPENVLTKEMLAAVSFREFAGTINHEWDKDRDRTWPASLLAYQIFVQSVEWHHTL